MYVVYNVLLFLSTVFRRPGDADVLIRVSSISIGKQNERSVIGPKGNSEFCFPKNLSVPEVKPSHCFPWGQSFNMCSFYTSSSA